MPVNDPRLSRLSRTVLVPGLLAVGFTGEAVRRSPFHHDPVSIAVVALLYFLVLVASWVVLAEAVDGRAWPLRLAAATPLALVLATFGRSTFRASLTVSSLVFLLAMVSLASLRVARFGSRSRSVVLGSVIALIVGSAALARVPTETRWQLLQNHPPLGAPLHYAWGQPFEETRNALARRLKSNDRPLRHPTFERTPGRGREHVVVIVIDALRADALAAWGGRPEWMPAVNSFTERAFRMMDVRANSSWTKASIASLFTGLLPEEHGARDRGERLADRWHTLAEVFRSEGYRTAAFVTNGNVGSAAGFGQGFEVFVDDRSEPYLRGSELTAMVTRHLSSLSTTEPQFIYVHYLDPHTPYLSGKAPPDTAAAGFPPGYRAELASVDQAVGELLAAIDAVLGRTALVLLTSDHGEEFGEHDLFGHARSLYDEVVEVPLVVAGGGPGASHARLELRDFYDFLGRVAIGDRTGPARWATARGRQERYASLYLTTWGRLLRPHLSRLTVRSLESQDWLLVWTANGPSHQLYRHASDPDHRTNLAYREPEFVAELERRMDDIVGTWTTGEAANPAQEDLEQLRALGYIR